jgi:hypothetical protein
MSKADISDQELVKPFANRLAELLLGDNVSHALRLIRPVSLLLGQGSEHPDDKLAINPDRVGIWERRREDGQTYFIRRQDAVREYVWWSSLGRIGPKGKKTRVVLIGESVARGYLYDPAFTPSLALEMMLESELGKGAVEVLDLARTNLAFEARELAISALALEPDALVVFSGNNWGISSLQLPSDIPYIDTALRGSGVPGLKRFVEMRLGQRVSEVVSDVAAAYKARNVPVFWIVPEFNLADWRDPVNNAPHLREGANAEWMLKRVQAEEALKTGNDQAASRLAQEMIALDECTVAMGLYILADCEWRRGRLEETRRYLELAKDASVWELPLFAPRPHSTTQRTLREEARRQGNEVIDLPLLFADHLKGEIPDRRLFLDYCHMTSLGIQISMAATAARILHRLKGVGASSSRLASACELPSTTVEAEASFLAAIHNAHWWQPFGIVHYHCLRAVQAGSHHLAQIMQSYVDLQLRRTPMLMCRSAEHIAGMASQIIGSYLLVLNNQQLDRVLLDAIIASLKTVGIDHSEYRAQLERQEHSVLHHPTNLLEHYYCSSGMQEKEILWVLPRNEAKTWGRGTDYYKAYWRESKFVFVGEANGRLQLRLTSRLPDITTDNTISLFLNGNHIGDANLDRQWNTFDIITEDGAMREGLNEIVIRWPEPLFAGLRRLENAAADLIQGFVPDFFQVFGEIHSLIATVPVEAPLNDAKPLHDAVPACTQAM